MAVDMAMFGNPWEHIRLLSDRERNQTLIRLLERRAPGARVLEIGCGTGLLSCVAARLGATKVYALEPTPMVREAQAMVDANGLGDVVEVIEGSIQSATPRQVDLAFSELLNADPFVEGVLPAMAAARPWLAPGGRLAPSRLRVYAAGVREASSAREAREARAEVARLSADFDLDLGALDRMIERPGPCPNVYYLKTVATEPVLVWDLEVGVDQRPTDPVTVELVASEPGPLGGVAVWFEADLDEGITLHNRPGPPTHWGQLVSSFPEERGVGKGKSITAQIEVDSEGLLVHLSP